MLKLKQQWAQHKKKSILLGLLAVVIIYWLFQTVSFHLERAFMQTNPTKWAPVTHCTGRYQIGVPANYLANTMKTSYDNFEIGSDVRFEKGVRGDAARYSLETIRDVRDSGTSGSQIYVTDREVRIGKFYFYVTAEASLQAARDSLMNLEDFHKKSNLSKMEYSSELLETYKKYAKDIVKNGLRHRINFTYLLDNYVYSIPADFKIPYDVHNPKRSDQLVEQEIDKVQAHLQEKLINRLQPIKNGEVPKGNGVCLDGAFIADKDDYDIRGLTSIEFTDYEDFYLLIHHSLTFDPKKDQPLTSRGVIGPLPAFIAMLATQGYHLIHQGGRNIGDIKGSERLVSRHGNEFRFTWEAADGHTRVELIAGKDNKTPITEKQMLEAWETILPTFKWRK